MTTTRTGQLAEFAAQLQFSDLPPAVVHQTKRFFLDAVGCAIGTYRENPEKARLVGALVDSMNSGGLAGVIGGRKVHPATAALANGILINATDNDDTNKRALVHVGSVVVPAALAMCQHVGGSGRDLCTALVAGYEVAARVGMAVMPSHYRYWHSTATNGTFGAAAAAARAMRLSVGQTTTALGFAGTQAAGLNTFFESGDDTKGLHPGKAGLNGVLSAEMSALGFSSPNDIFGHPKGYLAAYSENPRPEMLTRELGTEWMILENGFKFYPSILASHSPIGAALDIANSNNIDPSAISSVVVRTYATVKSHFSSKSVETTMAARLSVPYCVAAALVKRTLGQAEFQPGVFRSPLVRAVMEKVEVVADDNLTQLYPEKFPAHVRVTTADGRTFEREQHYPKGDPSNPLSDEELRAKFLGNTAGVMDGGQTEELLTWIDHLPDHATLAGLDRLSWAESST
ncbi:MmgE/PrpD family protein [Aminobacter sp. MSH1]|uniref:MmgE/PrpD family protein n=1 Tax=Aminobacter sp. MSH1 TaxID=374606 RepID=UPI000D391D2A|nr:MmgE/PrpD family protein [Aminobacter sp. MSH1]